MMKKLMTSSVVATMLVAGTFSTAAFAAEGTHKSSHSEEGKHTSSYSEGGNYNTSYNYESSDDTSFNEQGAASQPADKPTATTAKPTAAKPAPTNVAAATAAKPAAPATSSSDADKLIAFAQSLQGKVHYSYGKRNTSNPNNLTLDCSSYTQYVFQQALGVKIPWGSNAQYNAYQHIDKSQLKKGDLVFMSVGTSGKIGHVGIYIGGGKFIHNTTGNVHGVTTGDLNSGSYANRYIGAARVLK